MTKDDSTKDYSTETTGNLTVIRLHRDLELTQVLAMIDEVAELDQGSQRLWNLSECFDFTREQIQQIAEYGKLKWPSPSKVAYVASGDLAYGLLRMFEVYRDEENYRTKVFRSEPEALAWFADEHAG